MGWWGSSLIRLWCATGARRMCAGEGPIVLLFSSAYDDSSTALESLGLSVSVSVSLLCRTIETGPGFIFGFSFRMRTRGQFSCTWTHS